MDWDLIRNFVEIVQAGSLSEASRRSGVTRATVSQRVKELESQAGAQLLRRTTRRLEPTAQGRVLYERGVRMQAEAAAATGEVAGLAQTYRGLVRISVPMGIGEAHLVEPLLGFAERHPAVQLKVVFDNRIANLIASEIDVAVRIVTDLPDGVVARRIGDVPWCLCATPAYLGRFAPVKVPQDLAAMTFLSSLDGESHSLVLDEDGRRTTVTVPTRIVSPALPFIHRAVRQDLGLAVMPSYMVRDDLASGRLVRLFAGARIPVMGQQLHIVTLPNRFPTPAARALIELLRGELGKALAGDGD